MSTLHHDMIHSAERKDEDILHEDKVPSDNEAFVFVPNPELEKRILRKIDLRLIPTAMVMVGSRIVTQNRLIADAIVLAEL